MTSLWAFSILIVHIFGSYVVSGLRCYQCRLEDGFGDVGCGENPPPEKYIRECAQPQCWMKYSSNGTLHVERFCVAYATDVNGCIAGTVEDRSGQFHTAIECKCADEDGCNGYSPNIININAGGHGGNNGSQHPNNNNRNNNHHGQNNNNYNQDYNNNNQNRDYNNNHNRNNNRNNNNQNQDYNRNNQQYNNNSQRNRNNSK